MRNLNNLNSLRDANGSKWYRNNSYKLNSVLPTLIHDYARNRYYNSTQKTHSFPFTATRTTNATMFDNQGRLVWAPANYLPNGSGFGGTASSLPTGWTLSIGAVPGGTATVIGMRSSGDVNYMTVRFQGTNDAVTRYPVLATVASASAPAAVLGESYTGSFTFKLVEDIYGNFSSLVPRCEVSELSGGAGYLVSSYTSLTAVSTPTRFSHTRVMSNASVAKVNLTMAYTINASVTFDFTVEFGAAQVERTSVNSPQTFIPTTTAAIYKERLDYNSATLEARGLLVEGAGTNMLLYSRDKGTYNTVKVDVTTAITATDVSGVANAATNVVAGVAGTELLGADGGAVTAGSTITASLLVKSTGASPATWVRLGCVESSLTDGAQGWFNIATGALGSTSARGAGTAITSAITALRDGWYRVEVTCRPNAIYTVPSFFICSASADGSTTKVNNATYAIDYAQIEVGTAATSIIPTYAATATRAADTCTLTTGAWLSQTNNTWFGRFIPGRDVAAARRLFVLSDGTSNNLQGSMRSLSRIQQNWSVIAAATTFGPNTANASTNFAISKVAQQYGNTPNQAICLNGGTVATSVVAVPTSGYTTLDVGKTVASTTANLNGWILELRNYPDTTASGAQLQALTT